MPEEQELRLVTTLDDRASAGLSALQRNMREFGGGPQAANMERFRRQTREGAEGMTQLSGSMQSGAIAAGVIGGAIGAVGLKIVDMGISALANITNIRAYADSMRGLQQAAYTAGESAAQFKVNVDALMTAGISKEKATAQLTGFMEVQDELVNQSSATAQRILQETPEWLRPAMEDMMNAIATEPTEDAMRRVQAAGVQIRERAAEAARQGAREAGVQANKTTEAIDAELQRMEKSFQRTGGANERMWLATFKAPDLAFAATEALKTNTAEQEAAGKKQIDDAVAISKAVQEIEKSWGRVKTAITGALVGAGLVQLMEQVATWSTKISEDINNWSQDIGPTPPWIRTIEQTVAEVKQLIEWMNKLAAVLQAPVEFALGAARGEAFEVTQQRVLERQEAERARREEGLRTGEIVPLPLGGGIERGGVAGRLLAGRLPPREVTAQEREQRVEEEQAVQVAGYQSTGRGRIRRRGAPALAPISAEAPAIPAAAPAPMVAPAPEIAAAPAADDRALGDNTDATERTTEALNQLSGTITTQMGGLPAGRGAGVAEMRPSAAIMPPEPPASVVAPALVPTEAPAPAPATSMLGRAWEGMRGWFGGTAAAPAGQAGQEGVPTGGATGTVAAFAGEALGGGIEARQVGGPVRGGQPYLVGERGPEVVVPERSGRVSQTPDIARAIPGVLSVAGTAAGALIPGALGGAIEAATHGALYGAAEATPTDVLRETIPGMGLLAAMKRDSEQGHPMRTQLRNLLGIPDPGEPAPWQRGGGGGEIMTAQLDGGGGGADTIDTAAQYLDRAAAQNVNVNGTGKISVDVRAPAGTHVSAEGTGLFKATEIVRQTQMLPAESGAMPNTGVGSATGVMTNGTA